MLLSKKTLTNGWRWKERNLSVPNVWTEALVEDGWTEAPSIPTEIHSELVRTQAILNPVNHFGEHASQCALFK